MQDKIQEKVQQGWRIQNGFSCPLTKVFLIASNTVFIFFHYFRIPCGVGTRYLRYLRIYYITRKIICLVCKNRKLLWINCESFAIAPYEVFGKSTGTHFVHFVCLWKCIFLTGSRSYKPSVIYLKHFWYFQPFLPNNTNILPKVRFFYIFSRFYRISRIHFRRSDFLYFQPFLPNFTNILPKVRFFWFEISHDGYQKIRIFYWF